MAKALLVLWITLGTLGCSAQERREFWQGAAYQAATSRPTPKYDPYYAAPRNEYCQLQCYPSGVGERCYMRCR